MNVPSQINGMQVVQCCATSTRGSTAGLFNLKETGLIPAVTNVAICRAPNGIGYWTMFCSRDWTCVTTEFGDTLLDAQLAADRRSAIDIQWYYPEVSAARLLPVAQKYLAYSIIVGIMSPAPGIVLAILAIPTPFPSLLASIGTVISVVLSTGAGIAAIAATLAIWFLVGYVGIKQGGWLYGVLHFLLVIVLTPMLLVGPFVIPHLLASDFQRRREWEERHRGAGTPSAVS